MKRTHLLGIVCMLACIVMTSTAIANSVLRKDIDVRLLSMAMTQCKNANPKYAKKDLIISLIDIEKQYKVPASLRGMLLAAACMESGFNPNAEGDHKFSKKRKPMAIGLFQMWPWWESKRHGYGINRRDPIASAHAYIKHIKRQLKSVKRKCKFRSEKKRWIAAWVTAIRAPKAGGRCKEKPKHLRLLKAWYKKIAKIAVPVMQKTNQKFIPPLKAKKDFSLDRKVPGTKSH